MTVPSDIVTLIDRVIPGAKTIQEKLQHCPIGAGYAPFLRTLLNLLDRIDPNLIPHSGEDATALLEMAPPDVGCRRPPE